MESDITRSRFQVLCDAPGFEGPLPIQSLPRSQMPAWAVLETKSPSNSAVRFLLKEQEIRRGRPWEFQDGSMRQASAGAGCRSSQGVAREVMDSLEEGAALVLKSDSCPPGLNFIAVGDTIQLSNLTE